MRYEFKADDARELASAQGWKTKERGGELIVEYCPYCGSNSTDKWKFSINLEKGVYNCFRGSCGAKGHFVQLARDMNFKIQSLDDIQYVKPKQVELKVSSGAERLFAKRGISKLTVSKYKLQLSSKFPNTMVFPFIDDKGVQVGYKCRKADFNPEKDKMKEWFSPKGTKPILFGMQCATDYDKPLVITEGQLDALSLDTAGIPNAVSVPTGANGFSWVRNCREWVRRFHEIIIFGDNDQAGQSMIDGIQKHFKGMSIKVVPKESYLGEKDANDILMTFGEDEVRRAFSTAEKREVKEIVCLADVETIDLNSLPGIKTGITKLDECIGKMYFGGVYVLTGRRGEGKSTFASQIFANALDQNEICLAYSGELASFHFKNWLVSQIKGKQHSDCNPEIVDNWLRGRAYIYDDNELWESGESKKVCDSIEDAIMTDGVRFILVDNLMTLMADYSGDKDFYLSQQNVIRRLKFIAKAYGVVILLIAHPKKEIGELGNDSISGSGVISDIADAVITYSRNPDKNTINQYQSLVGVTKNRMRGDLLKDTDRLQMLYSKSTKRIIEVSDDGMFEYSCFRQQEQPEEWEEVPF